MASRADHREIPFLGGLDTYGGEIHVEPPSLLGAENVDYSEPGRLKRRVGYELLTSTLSGPHIVHERNGSLYAQTKSTALIYDDTEGVLSGSTTGFADSPLASNAVFGGNGNASYADVAVGSGYRVAATVGDTSGTWLEVDLVSSETGNPISNVSGPNLSTTVESVRVVVTGTNAALVYVEGTTVKARRLDLTSASSGWSAATTLRSDVSATDKFLDAVAVDSTTFAYCYVTNAGSIRTETITTSTFATVNNRTDAFAGTLRCIGIYWSASESSGLTLFGDSTNGVQGKHWTSVLGLTSTTTVDAGVTDAWNVSAHDSNTSGNLVVWYTENAATTLSRQLHMRESTISTGAAGTKNTRHNLCLSCKPFAYDSAYYAPAVWDNDLDEERTGLLVAFADSLFSIASRSLYLSSDGALGRSHLGGTSEVSTGVYVSALIARAKIVADASVHTGVEKVASLTEWDFRTENRHVVSNYGRGTFVPSGIGAGTPLIGATDQGFVNSPSIEIAPAVGGSAQASAQYVYAAVYQKVDASGQVHWSPPSVLKTDSTSAFDNSFDITIHNTPGFAQKVLIFRSQANDTAVLNLAQTVTVTAGAATTTLNEGASDASIATNEILYTNGDAQLSRHMAPPCRFSNVHDERLWAISDDDGSIWHSHRVVDPEAAGFNPTLSIPGVEGGRRPVGLASLSDSRQVVLWDDRLAVINGSGPSAANIGGTYSDPLPLPSPVGCSDPRTIAETHLGVIFQSTTGFFIVAHTGQVERISRPVADYETDTCVKVVQLEDQTEIAFVTVSGSDTRVLYWEYDQNRWSTQTIASKTAVSATAHEGRLTILFDDGEVWKAWAKSDDRYDFGGIRGGAFGSHAPMTVETAWIKASGKQGHAWLQSVFAIVQWLGVGGLRFEAAYNYDPTYVERADYGNLDLNEAKPVHLELTTKTKSVGAFKLKLEERNDGGVASAGIAVDSIRYAAVPTAQNFEYGKIKASRKKGLATI